jgi:methionyl-tRNA synthetase
MTASSRGRTTVIIAPPPTPNGDLHVGHLAGPYLAGDVYARYLRACGRPVVTSARKLGTTPEQLCARSGAAIQRTLDVAGISVDGFAAFDDGYRRTVLEFVTALHAAGRFRLRTVELPYLESTGEFLMEGLVSGDCPVCLAESRGGLCETCGHPNLGSDLLHPQSTTDPGTTVTLREAEILVLPMEEYRERLVAHYAARRDFLRPHIRQLVDEAFDRPLPDFPITYPTPWGIPAPFPETPGQVLNAWAEGMAASMYCTWWAGGRPDTATDASWRTEQDPELVYFLGFDNVYFWGLTHLALLMAHGDRYVEPHAIVCNEFYELENDKFSTSRGHVVWTADLLAEVPRDAVRFFLALTAPEHARTNFSRAGLEAVAGKRLVAPWNRLADRLDEIVAELDGELPVSASGRRQAAAILARFRACYELPHYSLHRAASELVTQLDRVARWADRYADDGGRPTDAGDLLLSARTLLACASPVLVDAAATARADGTDLSLADDDPATGIHPFAWPRLAVATVAARPTAGTTSRTGTPGNVVALPVPRPAPDRSSPQLPATGSTPLEGTS